MLLYMLTIYASILAYIVNILAIFNLHSLYTLEKNKLLYDYNMLDAMMFSFILLFFIILNFSQFMYVYNVHVKISIYITHYSVQ